jgi:hydrogenase/urease accessory protein HupE
MINRWEPPTKSSTGARIGRSLCCSLLLIMVLLLPCGTGFAHDLGLSGVTVAFKNGSAQVTVVTPVSRLMRAEGASGAQISPVTCDIAIRKRLQLAFDGAAFVPARAIEKADPGTDMLTWQASMPHVRGQARVTLAARLYPEDAGTRTLLIVKQEGGREQRIVLDAAHQSFESQNSAPGLWSTARRFAAMGTVHIFTGADHILFVVALLLTAASLRSVLKIVTAFTVAHSITLSLTALAAIAPPARIVEPLIALSISVTAAENLRLMQARRAAGEEAAPGRDLRMLCAFCFGLVHGCGFAGGLTEVGLSRGALALPLASFNLGVELGQCAIVACVLPLVMLLGRRSPAKHRGLVTVCSCVIGVVGAYWCFARMHGG